jgi:hypothetical protein
VPRQREPVRSCPDARPPRSVSLEIHRREQLDQDPEDPEDPDDPEEPLDPEDPEEPLDPDEFEPLLVVDGVLLPEPLDPLLESFEPPSPLVSFALPLPPPVLLDDPLRLSVR